MIPGFRRSCACSFIWLLASSFLCRGQDQPLATATPNDGTSEAERVIVTGSHIPTAEEVGPNPVLTINRDFIEKSPERTAEAQPVAGYSKGAKEAGPVGDSEGSEPTER